MVCFRCGRYGHKRKDCPLLEANKKVEPMKEVTVQNPLPLVALPGRRIEDRSGEDAPESEKAIQHDKSQGLHGVHDNIASSSGNVGSHVDQQKTKSWSVMQVKKLVHGGRKGK